VRDDAVVEQIYKQGLATGRIDTINSTAHARKKICLRLRHFCRFLTPAYLTRLLHRKIGVQNVNSLLSGTAILWTDNGRDSESRWETKSFDRCRLNSH